MRSREGFSGNVEKESQKQEYPEDGAASLEFYATEAGNVASHGRREIDQVEAEVNGMLANRKGAIASIKKALPQTFEELAREEKGSEDAYRQSIRDAVEHSSDPWYREAATKRLKEWDAIKKREKNLTTLSQKLDNGESFSSEEAGILAKAVRGNDSFLTHLFLARLSKDGKENPKKRSGEDNREAELRRLRAEMQGESGTDAKEVKKAAGSRLQFFSRQFSQQINIGGLNLRDDQIDRWQKLADVLEEERKKYLSDPRRSYEKAEEYIKEINELVREI